MHVCICVDACMRVHVYMTATQAHLRTWVWVAGSGLQSDSGAYLSTFPFYRTRAPSQSLGSEDSGKSGTRPFPHSHGPSSPPRCLGLAPPRPHARRTHARSLRTRKPAPPLPSPPSRPLLSGPCDAIPVLLGPPRLPGHRAQEPRPLHQNQSAAPGRRRRGPGPPP